MCGKLLLGRTRHRGSVGREVEHLGGARFAWSDLILINCTIVKKNEYNPNYTKIILRAGY